MKRRWFFASVLFIVSASLSLAFSSYSLPNSVTLRSLAEKRGIEIGAAVAIPPLKTDPMYPQLLASQFNSASAENVMKFEYLHPQPNTYTFNEADTLVDFAKSHNMTVHAHVLVWHIQLPKWLTEGKFSRDQLITILRDHIHKVVGYYKGKVQAWDVVNEALNDDGTLRNTIWLQGIGPDYIEMAFRWAREADPNVELYYNDFGADGFGPKSDAVYNLVKKLKAKQVPITGVGLQMHVGLGWAPPKRDVIANINRLGDLGLNVHISEMDVQTYDGARTEEEKLQKAANIYADMMSACLSNKACKSFTVWGLTDKFSWLPGFTGKPNSPLLFNTNYRPNPAYYALIDVLQNK